MLRILAIGLLALSQVACVSSRSVRHSTDDTLLGVQQLEDGSEVSWRLNAGRSGDPTLEKTVTAKRAIARLGVTCRAIGKQRAERYGIDPWRGVWVDRVDRRSPVDEAGLRVGDVLVSIDGIQLSSPEQLTQVVEDTLEPGVVAQLVVARVQDEDAAGEFTLDVVPEPKQVTDSSTDSIPLGTSDVVRRLTGLRVAEVSRELAADALGMDRTAVLVASVVLGSPAYLAGLRPGDRLVTVDGHEATSLDRLVASVLARADERGISIATSERKGLEAPRAAEGPLKLAVTGPLGAHETSLEVVSNLGEDASIDIPILFECDSDVTSTRWSLLDFVFQFGANYRGYYLDSTTRDPARYTFFSMLPFGFFEVERHPGRSRYCILWFIEWETQR